MNHPIAPRRRARFSRWALIAWAGCLALGLYSDCPAATSESPKVITAVPERGSGRLGASEFFKRFPEHTLEFRPIRKSHDLGTFKPGDKCRVGYVVSAKGEIFGLNHKGAPKGKAVFLVEVPASGSKGESTKRKYPPEGGCG